MKRNELIKGIKTVFSTNIVVVLFGIINGIVLPKYLSIDSYAQIKTFQLYYAYLGLLHLGVADALQIKYGGCDFNNVNKVELSNELAVYRTFFLVEEILAVVVATLIDNYIVMALASTMLFTNIISCYKIIYQATGNASGYGRTTLIISLLKFLANVAVILSKSDSYIFLITAYVVIDIIICIVTELKHSFLFIKFLNNKITILLEGIKIGFPILIGNFIVNLLMSIDRWYVKFGGINTEFAYYSFAVSIQQLAITMFKPFQIALYSFLCKNKDDYKKIGDSCSCIVAISAISCSLIFPIKWMIRSFISKYVFAISVVVILFATIIPNGVINSVYINLYKVYGNQKKYFWRSFLVVVTAAFLDLIVFINGGAIEKYAVATLVVSMIWYAISYYDFRHITTCRYDILKVIMSIAVLLLSNIVLPEVFGFVAYAMTIVLIHLRAIKKIYNVIAQ